jgi:hypothetical protein
MGVESTVLSFPHGSVSATARYLPFALTAAENSDAQQRAEAEVVVTAFGCEERHGSCLLVYRDDAAQAKGRVNEETVA